MTIQQASKEMGCSVLFLREWIAKTPNHPFGVAVNISGGKKRTFYINERAFERYMKGEVYEWVKSN